jgi:hypothetical protein
MLIMVILKSDYQWQILIRRPGIAVWYLEDIICTPFRPKLRITIRYYLL